MDTTINWREVLTNALNKSQFMSLGTHDVYQSWVAPVYFNFDEEFNFYFISQPNSRHVYNITKSPLVSAAIFNSAQEPNNDVLGLQLSGSATFVDEKEAKKAFQTYFSETEFRRPIKSDKQPEDYIGPNSEWRLIKITPKNIFIFDTEKFGEERIEITAESLKLK